jgi:hypothetical protein
MLHVMGFEVPVFAEPARIVPGAGRLLLGKDVLAMLRPAH